MSTNSRTVLSSFPPMKSNALHITRDSIRIFVPLRPLYGVPVYPSAGGDAHIAPRQVRWYSGGQDHPPYDGTSGTAFSRSTGNQRAAQERLCFTPIKKRPPYWVVVLAGAERLELSTRGFGDRLSNTTKKDHRMVILWQGQKGSNSRHAVLETAALPTELYPYMVGLRGLEPGTGRL